MTDRLLSAPAVQAAGIGMILILGSLTAFGPFSIDMYLPAFPAIEGELRTSATMVQLSLTACLIGLALGQLIAGSLSDQKGRKVPLLIGLAVYVLSSLLCAWLPSVEALIFFRFVQGVSGAAGIVISRAISRDMYAGIELTKFTATLMLVNGSAPILAPILGAQLLQWMSWRGIFVVLAAIGAMMFLCVMFLLRETLPKERRSTGGLSRTLADFRMLMRDRKFVGYALCQGFVLGCMFAYISGSPFVLQNLYDLSPQMFSLFFGVNALGIVSVAQFSGRMAGRVGQMKLFKIGIGTAIAGGVGLLVCTLSGGGLPLVAACIFLACTSVGFVTTTGFSMAMQDYGKSAGSASALLGVMSFLFGGIVAPLVGIGGTETAVPMAVCMAVTALAAGASYWGLVRPAPPVRTE